MDENDPVLKDLLAAGWGNYKSDPPVSGIIKALYMTSSVFPTGAIVQAAVEEIEGGVTGDKNPTLWKPLEEGQ